jgi:F-type H+-transporting ATPase subunit a
MAAESGGEATINALGQFKLYSVLGPLNFTQANLLMVVGAALTLGLLYFGMRPRAVVPGRLQAAAELAYNFVYNMCVEQIGPEGRRFFPFVFTLFFFILMGNLIGIIPFSFTYTSHIAVTAALAVMVIIIVTTVAILENGTHFFTEYFFPKGVPILLAPIIIPIEIISYLSRPVSLSIRLFANMVAGHVMFVVFASFTVMLASSHLLGPIVGAGTGILPIIVNIALVGLELLVAGLQAYVFAILTCIYLHDAVHLH